MVKENNIQLKFSLKICQGYQLQTDPSSYNTTTQKATIPHCSKGENDRHWI